MKSPLKWLGAGLLLALGCKAPEKITGTRMPDHTPAAPYPEVYRASNTRHCDILHQQLRVSFDWENKYLFGESTMDIKPYFYPVLTLYLNARGMQINSIDLVKDGLKQPLLYLYENDSLKITLDREYLRTDTFRIFIDYVAKPDELKDPEGSTAITSDKGLYFINPDGAEKNKPRQLWTQCETQAGSVWFPTIDSPNEQFTQEIYMTVDTALVTLSNGVLVSSMTNERQGLRTDYWRQMLPAAPYLTMMAAGDFRVVRDRWHDLEVSYFVDPEYEPYARNIFGNTPEMMAFFSERLGVDFPWEKYGQVVVHDYVSGAMENASATLHGQFMQRDARALLDQTNEDVVSHELFHQWFGDLVTCESWSNVPLNESFATYGEYLWNEYKYGREEADYYGMRDLDQYLNQAKQNDAPLIRFGYDQQEDVFDRITYQKGGRILHMLRKFLGDDAFFTGLKTYLDENRFQPVETHNLRLAMEKVSGHDLNWFFNQWFYNQGYPVLDISYLYIDSLKTQAVTIVQKQDFGKNPLFNIPMRIDIYTAEGIEKHDVVCEMARSIFLFPVKSEPLLVNVDAEKMLVCTKTDNKSDAAWLYQFSHGPLYSDKQEALEAMGKRCKPGSPGAELVKKALGHPLWTIRFQALRYTGNLLEDENEKQELKPVIMKLARFDEKAAVRNVSLEVLARHFKGPDMMEVYMSAITDSSYEVMSTALTSIAESDEEKGLALAAKYESSDNREVRKMVFGLYAQHGSDANFEYMNGTYLDYSGGGKYTATLKYGEFLTHCRPATLENGFGVISDVAASGQPWFIRIAGIQALSGLVTHCEKQAAENKHDSALAGQYLKLKERIESKMKAIKSAETDPNLTKIYGQE